MTRAPLEDFLIHEANDFVRSELLGAIDPARNWPALLHLQHLQRHAGRRCADSDRRRRTGHRALGDRSSRRVRGAPSWGAMIRRLVAALITFFIAWIAAGPPAGATPRAVMSSPRVRLRRLPPFCRTRRDGIGARPSSHGLRRQRAAARRRPWVVRRFGAPTTRAVDHLADAARSAARNGQSPEMVGLGTQQRLRSLQAAVGSATRGGVPLNQRMTVGGWDLEFRQRAGERSSRTQPIPLPSPQGRAYSRSSVCPRDRSSRRASPSGPLFLDPT